MQVISAKKPPEPRRRAASKGVRPAGKGSWITSFMGRPKGSGATDRPGEFRPEPAQIYPMGEFHSCGFLPPDEAAHTAKAGPDGLEILALHNIDGTFYATSNICTHAIAPLSNGFLNRDVVECPLHAGAFEVKAGKAVCALATEDIKTFPTRIVDGAVQIRID